MNLLTTITLISMLLANGGPTDPPNKGGETDPPKKAELRMKPAISLRGMHVTIGDICDITPVDEHTLALSSIRFGPAPTFGYARTITRTDVVRALAAAGVQLTTIDLTGSDRTAMQAMFLEVPQQDMLEAATVALQAQLAVEGGDVEFEPPSSTFRIKTPPGVVSRDLRARVRGTETHATSAVVDVEILVDGEVFKSVPVQFKLQRYHLVLKTMGSIRKGTPLGPDNVELAREPMAQHTGLFLSRIDQVHGMIASRNLNGHQRMTLGDLMPPAVIRKGDVVTVVLTRGRVKITTRAIANHDAALADRVTLTNLSSRSQMTGQAHGPGLVVISQ